MRRVVFRVIMAVVLCFFLTAATAPYWLSLSGVPRNLRVFPGMDLSLKLRAPLRVFDAAGRRVEFFNTSDLGSTTYQVSLFPWLPLAEVVVDVVPLIRLYPGGQSIGVLLSSDGLIVNQVGGVLGLDGVERFPAKEGGIQPGDILLSIEGHKLRRPEQVSEIINSYGEKKKSLQVVVKRQNRTFTCSIKPVKAKRADVYGRQSVHYLLGVYLEDPAAGVGTMSFYDEKTGRFGALGHTITDSLGRPIRIVGGSIVEATIDSVRLGLRGSPGEKLGFFQGEQDVLGSIDANTAFGIYGQLAAIPDHSCFQEPLPVAFAHQVKEGPALIYTVLQGRRVESFSVEIIKVVNQTKPSDKGIIIQVTDERLLGETGGIVQGMSGSPIVQNGMLVGAVTHVFVNDPTKGYGSFAEWMVYEAGIAEELPANNHLRGKVFFCM